MAPSIRNSGGTPAVMCRSEAFFCTMSSSSLRSETTMSSSREGGLRLFVGGRFLQHFLRRRDAALQLLERVTSQRQHSVLDGDALDLGRRTAVEDGLAQGGGDVHDLVHALAS